MEIKNMSNLSMDLTSTLGETVTITKNSNEVITNSITDEFTKVLSTTSTYILVGEESMITATLTNNTAIQLETVSFKNTLNAGLTFVAGSVILNDVEQPEADIITGIDLGNIEVTGVNVIKFKVTTAEATTEEFGTAQGIVNYTIQDPIEGEKSLEENTNSIDLEIIEADITVECSVNKGYAIKGNTLHYTTTITNGAKTEKSNLIFKNPIPEGSSFVAESVKIDDSPQTAYDPATGFALNNLAVETSTKVEFDVMVN